MKRILFLTILCALTIKAHSQSVVLSMRERAAIEDRWLENRMKTVMPMLMEREGIDMWILIAREYNEDPVLKTMLPATWLNARRRTMLVIYNPGDGKPLETLAIARYNVGAVFQSVWDKEQQPDQWARLMEVIEERKPKKIGINESDYFATADGLTATEKGLFMDRLPKKYQDRVVSAERLSIGWLETRTPEEMVVYEQICRIAHEIIAEGFSETVIQPGITTTDDVVWWYRDRIRERGLVTWFHPTVDVQRKDPDEGLYNFSNRPDRVVIMPGDLVHVDFGITYLGLNTDTQELAYVLRPGEQDAPQYLKDALKEGNEVQDCLTMQFATGTTGNEALLAAIAEAKGRGFIPQIYTHPIGYHGHGAGPAVGMWDAQGGVPGTGDYPIYPNTAYSIELNARVFVKEWDKEIRVMLEQEAFFDGEKVVYIDGRQTEYLLIPRVRPTHE
ncbi:MAG TPA: Xaa-Pro aminopeptidase [Cytophagales bacterium]|nr:Xaa-Pro aminopeptidase [Cytophagales bacterium]HAP65178.1 Xaa-Pro aminopeptidase [Cytophagales bacterium]